MRKPVPILATLVVIAAAATMVALGVWQLHRAEWKDALIAQAQRAQATSAQVPYPAGEAALEDALYRYTTIDCTRVTARSAVAGTAVTGEKGWAQRAECMLPSGRRLTVDLGFSRQPSPDLEWSGGEVRGVIAPGGRVVAAQGLAGLDPLATPDPQNLPNNHLAYAGQWFFFALTALAIYGLALRKRWKASDR